MSPWVSKRNDLGQLSRFDPVTCTRGLVWSRDVGALGVRCVLCMYSAKVCVGHHLFISAEYNREKEQLNGAPTLNNVADVERETFPHLFGATR